MVLREINVNTLVSTLTQRGLHQRDRLVILGRKKEHFSQKPTQDERGSNPGSMHEWQGRSATSLSPARHDADLILTYRALQKILLRKQMITVLVGYY